MAWCHELSEVRSYTKLKHASGFWARLTAVFSKVFQLFRLRFKRYDLMVYVGDGTTAYANRTVAFIRPKRAIAFSNETHPTSKRMELISSPKINRQAEFLEILKLAVALEIPEPYEWKMPLLRPPIRPDKTGLVVEEIAGYQPIIGIHLSARRPLQQWPTDQFAALIDSLLVRFPRARILVTWSPGQRDDSLHPGDDEKADTLAKTLSSRPIAQRVQFKATSTPSDLLRVQSVCDVFFCSDGGAMHLAAALGKRVIAMFGDSDHIRWSPIGDNHRVITTAGHDVREIDVSLALTEISDALNYGRA